MLKPEGHGRRFCTKAEEAGSGPKNCGDFKKEVVPVEISEPTLSLHATSLFGRRNARSGDAGGREATC